jgi:hypothetical protein
MRGINPTIFELFAALLMVNFPRDVAPKALPSLEILPDVLIRQVFHDWPPWPSELT